MKNQRTELVKKNNISITQLFWYQYILYTAGLIIFKMPLKNIIVRVLIKIPDMNWGDKNCMFKK